MPSSSRQPNRRTDSPSAGTRPSKGPKQKGSNLDLLDGTFDSPVALGIILEDLPVPTIEMGDGSVAKIRIESWAIDREFVLAGDLNDDGTVDIVDLNMVLIDWGKSWEGISDPRADANGDGTVDIVDLNTVLIDWGVVREF